MSCYESIGIYIHVPFCKSKCYYCDFNSYVNKEYLVNSYIDALCKEINNYSNKMNQYIVHTIFIGGGTPSYLDNSKIYDVIKNCTRSFNILPTAEISIEANPGTLTFDKLKLYKELGINRLSIGLQSSHSNILKFLGRTHTIQDFMQNIDNAKKAGFNNINVDLIFGIPGQTLDEWKDTLDTVIQLAPSHLSCYSLKIEDNTILGNQYNTGKLTLLDDELDRKMYHLTINMAARYGYNHYEISNFAKPKFECKHNLNYWNSGFYIGFGAGAHSHLGNNRFNNIYDIEQYILSIEQDITPTQDIHILTIHEKMEEYIMLQLRLTKGICLQQFKKNFNMDFVLIFEKQISKLLNQGLICLDDKYIKLSSLGLDLANTVLVEFISSK